MKTKFQALNEFWSGFGFPAYEENSVPDGDFAPAFPYFTYEVGTGSFEEDLLLNGSFWTRSTSWKEADKMLTKISDALGRGGKDIECEDGVMTVHKSNPFASTMGDPSDDKIKRLLITVIVQFKTSN